VDGGAVTDEWSVTAKQMLLQFAAKIHLPNRYVVDYLLVR